MKLKKIASLALAGVMVVSMLAGCKGDKTENNETEGEQNQVVTVTVADYANSLLSKAQKNVFEFKNSAELTAALQKVASDSEAFTSTEIKKYADVYAYGTEAVVKVVGEDLEKELDLDYSNATSNNSKDLVGTDKKGTKTIGFVYGVSGKLEQDTAVQLIINAWKDKFITSDYFPATITTASSLKLDCDYTAEISAVKVTAPDDKNAEEKASTWVIAIVVTQTATEATNV